MIIDEIEMPWGEVYHDVRVRTGEYDIGIPAVIMTLPDGETLAVASVNLSEYGIYPSEGCIFIKDYSEGIGMLDLLEKHGVVQRTGLRVTFGPFNTSADEARVLLKEKVDTKEEK